jgi:LacI family transcriptional regulator
MQCSELSVIGFDDDRIASYIVPGLTTIRQPSYEKGLHAIRHLISSIEKGVMPCLNEELPCLMIYRQSCGKCTDLTN